MLVWGAKHSFILRRTTSEEALENAVKRLRK
jgi:hypothetical protein